MYHDVVELDPLCVHHMTCEHTNTLSTVFCIVIPIVKIWTEHWPGHAINISKEDLLRCLSYLDKKIIWHLRHVILLTVNQTGQTTVSVSVFFLLSSASCFLSGIVQRFNSTALSDGLSWTCCTDISAYVCSDICGKPDKWVLYRPANFIKVPFSNVYKIELAYRRCGNCGISVHIFII